MKQFIPYSMPPLTESEQIARSEEFFVFMNRRRSVRFFSDKPVHKNVLELIIRTAGTAPSGANKQPWKFVVVTDPAVKQEIRRGAEKEEKENYEGRMPKEWLEELKQFGTDWHKEFLEMAPALIVVFALSYDKTDERIRKNYYVKESVGLAAGFLLAAIHHAGLAALTHTPSPMDFLGTILGRPANEKPFLLIPVGFPAEGTTVPDIHRKSLNEICEWR